jgi:hypothetical protein
VVADGRGFSLAADQRRERNRQRARSSRGRVASTMSGLSTDDRAACAKPYTHLKWRTTKVCGPNRLVGLPCQQRPRGTRIAISGTGDRLTNCSTARGSRVSKSISFAHVGSMAMRAICWYSAHRFLRLAHRDLVE